MSGLKDFMNKLEALQRARKIVNGIAGRYKHLKDMPDVTCPKCNREILCGVRTVCNLDGCPKKNT